MHHSVDWWALGDKQTPECSGLYIIVEVLKACNLSVRLHSSAKSWILYHFELSVWRTCSHILINTTQQFHWHFTLYGIMIWAYDTQATKTLEVWKPKYGEKKMRQWERSHLPVSSDFYWLTKMCVAKDDCLPIMWEQNLGISDSNRALLRGIFMTPQWVGQICTDSTLMYILPTVM